MTIPTWLWWAGAAAITYVAIKPKSVQAAAKGGAGEETVFAGGGGGGVGVPVPTQNLIVTGQNTPTTTTPTTTTPSVTSTGGGRITKLGGTVALARGADMVRQQGGSLAVSQRIDASTGISSGLSVARNPVLSSPNLFGTGGGYSGFDSFMQKDNGSKKAFLAKRKDQPNSFDAFMHGM